MKLSPSGASVTTSKPRKTAPPPNRTKNRGWTKHAALRNRAFLWSVVPEQLSGFGYSITHTVLHCDCPNLWQKWVSAYLDNLRKRWPLTRYHLVVEWQKRGMPHLHAAVWFHGLDADRQTCSSAGHLTGSGPNGTIIEGVDIPLPEQLIRLWMKVAAAGEPARVSQDVKTITTDDAGHWLQYLAKHAVRGVSNYQRSSENVPALWKGETGRVWRKGGDWPTENRVEVHGLTKDDEYQYRRVFCRYLASLPASMRVKQSDKVSVQRYWKSWRKCSDTARSHLRAPSSFISIETQVRIIKSINPAAYFVDEITGEYYSDVDEMPVDRSPSWVQPKYHRVETSIDDLC